MVLRRGLRGPCSEAPHLLDKQGSVTYHAKERYVLFSGGFTEVGFILFMAFLLFGPKKLPEIARVLGKGMGELRRASNELKSSLEEEIRNLDRKDEDVSYKSEEASYTEPETHPYEDASYKSEDSSYTGEESSYAGEESSYTEHETHPYVETEEESYEHPEEATPELSHQSEGDLEPVSEYGHDYSEPPQQEPEPRPRG